MSVERIIIVKSRSDGDILCVVSPTDNLNPQFDRDEINKNPELDAEIHALIGLQDFLIYDVENS